MKVEFRESQKLDTSFQDIPSVLVVEREYHFQILSVTDWSLHGFFKRANSTVSNDFLRIIIEKAIRDTAILDER